MDGYPLLLSVPQAHSARGMMGLRHTVYFVQIDDCGKIYERYRRYTNFLWLHRELRQREVPALPELPPKKAVGKLDIAFIEQRRRLLEAYLCALLRLPAVVADDTLWAFLEADKATAVVPRFLCKGPSPLDASKTLHSLEAVGAKEANLFRFCNAVVLKALSAFAQAEASESTGQPQHRQDLPARLSSRVSLCAIVQSLTTHDRAKQYLTESGMFGALLSLLWRTSEDLRQVRAASTIPNNGMDLFPRAITTVIKCLTLLLECSKGTALLDFCQQDSGLRELQRLAVAEDTALHSIVAALLWHGFQSSSVVRVLAGSKTGLPLFGKLLKSPDLGARMLAGLCVGCLVRQEGALDTETREFCLDAMEPLPAELERAEAEAVERVALASLELSDLAPDDYSNAVPKAAASECPANCAPADVAEKRDQALRGNLVTVCQADKVWRLGALLGPPGEQPVNDAVTRAVVAMLDHFVRQSADEPERVRALQPLAQQLHAVVDGGAEAAMGSELVGRAARVLIRLDWPGAVARAAGHDAPNLTTFGRRVRMLQAVAIHADANHAQSAVQLARAGEQDRSQNARAEAAGLVLGPRLTPASLKTFGAHLKDLTDRRTQLDQELRHARQSLETTGVTLDQRGVKRTVLTSDIEEMHQAVTKRAERELRTEEAQATVTRCEEQSREAAAQAEAEVRGLRMSEAASREAVARAQEAEERSTALLHTEAEKAEICHNAPAQAERLRAHLASMEQSLASKKEALSQTLAEADQEERRRGLAVEGMQETKTALTNLAEVRAKLTYFRGQLTSETVLSDGEMEKLKQLEAEMQPAKPARLRHPQEGGGGHEASDDTDAPVWDDNALEQAFRESVHFRSFVSLCDKRERLWAAELQWLQAQANKAEASASRLELRRRDLEAEQRSDLEEVERLKRDISFWSQSEQHRQSHCEACVAAAAARDESAAEAAKASEATGNQHLAEVRMERAWSAAKEAETALAAAREMADAEAEQSLRERLELERRALDLEARMRTFLDGGLATELEEQQVVKLQGHAAKLLQNEAQSRQAMRAEIKRLLGELRDLDRQLDVESEATAS